MDQWLPLTDYATKYKVSVSTLRRRIKSEDIKYKFKEGKYFINDMPISIVSTKNSPSLGHSLNEDIEAGSVQTEVIENKQRLTADQDFLERLRKTANTRLPQLKSEQGVLNKSKNGSSSVSQVTTPTISIEEDYYLRNLKKESTGITSEFDFVEGEVESDTTSGLKGFSEKISKIGNNEPILTAANKLLAELKKAYTQILQEKEEQITTLKEEVSDLKTLVKVLESENSRLKSFNSL